MASTHTLRNIRTSASLAANATSSGTEWNNSTAYGGIVNCRITNGASPPTTVPVVRIYTGSATGVKRLFATFSGDLVASSVNDFACVIPPQAMFVNVDFIGGATNAVTAEGDAQELTGI